MLWWRSEREWYVEDWRGREWRFRALDPDEIDFAKVPFDLAADPEGPLQPLIDEAFNWSGAKDDRLAAQLLAMYDRVTGRHKSEEMPRPTNDPQGRLRGFRDELERALSVAYQMGVLTYERRRRPTHAFPLEEAPTPYVPQPVVAEDSTFIGVRLVDQDGVPVRRRVVHIEPSGGVARESSTDVSGRVGVHGVTSGKCTVTLLDVDHRDVVSPTARPAGGNGVAGAARTVRQGDTAPSIAAAAGFLWSDTVWTVPENKDLRERRPDPNVLLPGDTLHVPDRTPPSFSLPTGAEHLLTIRRTKLQVRVRLLDWLGAARAAEDCTVSNAGGEDLHVTTDGDGKLTFEVPADVQTATIACASGDHFTVRVGGLNPVDTLTGVGARLRNLGLQGSATDSMDAALGDRLRLAFAVELFADLANTRPSKDTNKAFGDRIRKDYGL